MHVARLFFLFLCFKNLFVEAIIF